MGIAGNDWGFQVGTLPKGARDKISDVPGVTVGHCTLADGVVQTGVTALLPHQGDIFHEKVLAASYVINGFGKTTGLVQIDELGTLETPILFTNTLSVGTAQTALYNAGRFIGGASAPVVIPIIAAGHGFGFAIGCVACIYVVAFIAMFFLPEKKGSDLE